MLFLAAGCSGNVYGQSSISDTVILIQDVVVNASRSQHFRNDLKAEIFTEKDLMPFAGESLGRFLMLNTALNIRAYGVGGAASSLSLRGSPASHTQVNWNGFPINSVTLGSYDFSMAPAGGFDRISVVYGAPASLYGSGTFGGAVNLDNNLQPGRALKGSAQMAYNTLETISGSTSLHLGTGKFAWKMSAWGSDSDNRFTYYDYIRQSKREQTDGAWRGAGLIQNVALKLPSSIIEAGMWYQVKAYNIPSRMGSSSYEFQKDSTLKFYAGYRKTAGRWGLHLKAAIFSDRQAYLQKESEQATDYLIESRISSRQAYLDAGSRYYVTPSLSVDIGITGTYITAQVSSYGGLKNEKGLAAFAGLRYSDDRLYWQVQLRKEWNSNFSSGFLPSAGLSWKAIPGRLTLRANYSKKFRKPTFNDLYWLPGGNSGLEPEKGYSLEAGTIIKIWENENMEVSADAGFFWWEIKDMIAWHPSATYWIAENYYHTSTAGLDAKIVLDMDGGALKYHSSFMAALSHSYVKNSDGDEELMLYSPPVITSWENRLSAGIFDFTLWHNFTSVRYYDNDSRLDSYHLFNASAGVKIPVWKGKLGIHLTVDNLAGQAYELIRLYPMPGRYWSVKMNYTF